MFRHAGIFRSWRRRRMYPIYFEQVMSLIWVLLWLLLTITEIFKLCYDAGSYMPYLWKSQFLSVICMVQFTVALCLERQYDKGIFKYMVSAAWYPVIYWVVNGLVALMALPGTLLRKKKKLATWKSPDRGIDTSSEDSTVFEISEDDENAVTIHLPDEEASGEKSEKKDKNIIDGKQVWWKKILEILLCGLAWAFILVYFFYVIYGFTCLAMGKTPFTFWIYTVEMLHETKHLLFITFIILLIEVVVMIVWKEYNRLKYGSLRRRNFKPDATVEQVADFMDIPEEALNAMRSRKIIVLRQNIISKNFKAERKELLGEKIKKAEENSQTPE